MEEKKSGGKRPGQKYKSLLVWQYLQKHADEEHAVKMEELLLYLQSYGIPADRHSVARDIHALQELFSREAEDGSQRDGLDYELYYDSAKHGYLLYRPYDFEELRLLAECVNGAKFLTKEQAAHLKGLISDLCSETQARDLENDVFHIEAHNSNNPYLIPMVLRLREAIRNREKVSFGYLRYSLSQRTSDIPCVEQEFYVTDPYYLLANNGYYYLLAFDTRSGRERTYRIDRMKNVQLLGQPREGEQYFAKLDVRAFRRRVFSMFIGEESEVCIRFPNRLLGTAIDSFGTGADTFYRPDGEEHFILNTRVHISAQFFSWLCGLRLMAKLIAPPEAVEGMKQYLSELNQLYKE